MATETLADYKNRLFGYLGSRPPVATLRDTPGALTEMLENIPDAVATASPAPGAWSIAQIVAHFAEGEIIFATRIRTALATSGAPIPGYDQDRWAGVGRYQEIPLELSLDVFRAARRWNLNLLERLDDAEWERFGIHSERGRESVREMVRLFAGHDLNHLQQIERILGSHDALRR